MPAPPALPAPPARRDAAPPWLDTFSLASPPPGFVDDPYPFWAALAAHAPRHRLREDTVLLTRHADVLAVYRSAHASSDKRREFAPRMGAGSPTFAHHTTSLVFSDPPRHTRVRRLMVGALSQRAIARMEAGVVALVDGLLDAVDPARGAPPVADLIGSFAARIPVEVIGDLLAVPASQRGALRGWSLDILSALEPAPDAALLARADAAVTDFLALLRELVAARRRSPGDPDTDVLTRLLQGDADGAIEPEELLHHCIFLLNAGHETTTNLIGNGLDALLRHPSELARLRADPALLPTAVEELLRFESPLQLNNRLATAAIALPDGTAIEPGTFVTLALGAANRDPAVFAAPDRLDVARRPNPHLAFGQGAHACAGMNVARLEARVALGRLLARFAVLAAAGTPARDRRVRFRGLATLPVRLG